MICSFTQAFAYLYSSKVATVLEGYVVSVVEPWHYSLYAFMDGVESFYGSAMKDKIDGDTLVLTQYVRMKEFHLYGSSRLGILNQNDTLKRADLHYKLSLSDPSQEPELFVETQDLDQYAPDSIYTLKQGNRLYEGSNHLGNVLVTFSDKRLGYCTNDTIYYYKADIRTANDYSAFGAPLDDRQWYSTADSGVYRFGFNGHEKNDEIQGTGHSVSAQYWQYDPRLGRRWNIDPEVKFWESSYACFSNNPIFIFDKIGLSGTPGTTQAEVQNGDGPSRFAKRNGISMAKLVELNPLVFPQGITEGTYMIHPGQMLTIAEQPANNIEQNQLSAEYKNAIAKSSQPFDQNGGKYKVRHSAIHPITIGGEWGSGTGPINSVIVDNHPMIPELKKSKEVERLRFMFYQKYKAGISGNASYTSFDSDFGAYGYLFDTHNWTVQMVGTFKGDIFLSEDGKNLIFVITDSKSMTSFFIHMLPSHERSFFSVGGKNYQKYIWTEPIDPCYFENNQGDRHKDGREKSFFDAGMDFRGLAF